MTDTPSFELATLSPKAFESIRDSNARINIWHGAVRSGKTISSLIKWGMHITTRPLDGQYMMIGRTVPALVRNCIVPLVSLFGASNIDFSPYRSKMQFFGRTVHLVGANDDKASDKIRGITLTDAYGDELSTWPESVFAMLLTRLSVKGAKFFGTTNPDSPGHWLKKKYLDRARSEIGRNGVDLKSWQFKLSDNLALEPDYIEALKSEFSGMWYKRFVGGEWVQAEGAIYDNIKLSSLVKSDDPGLVMAVRRGERYFGIDYGTTNPFVCLDAYIYDDKLYIVNEYRFDSAKAGYQKADSEYASDLVIFSGYPTEPYPLSCIVDPSASSLHVELSQAGFSITKGNNRVLEGIRQTYTLLAQVRLFIAEDKCPTLIEELRGYRWDARASTSGVERPVKDKDHGPDALRYIIATKGLAKKRDRGLEMALINAKIYK